MDRNHFWLTERQFARLVGYLPDEWDADKVSGRAFRDALKLLGTSERLSAQATDALRTLRQVQQKVTKKFSFVRNAAIGHRDPHALAQYRAIRDLKVEDVISAAVEFFTAVDQFLGALSRIMSEGSTLQSHLRQWISSEQQKPTGRT